MSTDLDWKIIDFHSHVRPPWWTAGPIPGPKLTFSEEERISQIARFKKMTDLDLFIQETKESDVSLRVINATIEGFFGIEGPTDIDQIRRINDFLAQTQRRYPGRLAALATIDAFSGKSGALEVVRAIKELSLAGIVIDSSRDDHFFQRSSTVWPTLEAAAEVNVPVFVHPVGASNSEMLSREGGMAAYALGRGFVNGVALLSILNSGILEKLPNLNFVFAGIGVGALIIALTSKSGPFSPEKRAEKKPNIYFDIMGFEPSTIRYLVDVLGADRVLVGSDWPIWSPSVSRPLLERAFTRAGLKPEEQKLIAETNARRLLHLTT